MSDERDTAELLRQGGRRCTVQRLKVASALREARGHRTAEEIYSVVRDDEAGAAFSLSTIYRALEALKELRLVAEVDAGGRAVYEWMDPGDPHHHLCCVRCGSERPLDPKVMTRLTRAIEVATGFQPFLDHLAIDGVCHDCASNERASNERATKVTTPAAHAHRSAR